MKILITGGSGFIGSALVRYIIENTSDSVINVDKLTYASDPKSLESVRNNKRYFFENVDICDALELKRIFEIYKPDAIMHLAAETHVDRSIKRPADFIQANIVGTFQLLEAAKEYWKNLNNNQRSNFKFHHISTDEVYGDLESGNKLFTELTPYNPSSPYSASKAASDHLVRAWNRTYKLPVVLTNCSNNYGPFQFPEKLIPLVILNALEGEPLPIYGAGDQVRDWLYVEDHAVALYTVVNDGKVGETYNIGGHNEKSNIDVVMAICSILDSLVPLESGFYREQIVHVADRPGHDKRYAIDASKIQEELFWEPRESFESGLRKTILWHLENLDWCKYIKSKHDSTVTQ